MKKIILLYMLVFLTLIVKSQTIVPIYDVPTFPEFNKYYKDINNDLEKFTGVWLYNDGNHYLKINIIKVENEVMHINPIDNEVYYRDYIYIKIQYKYNNILLYDTLSSQLPKLEMIQGNGLSDNGKELLLYYDEPPINDRCKRNKVAMLKVTYIQSNFAPTLVNNDTLNWIRIPSMISFPIENCDDGLPEDTSDFLIPDNITLHRE